jgi:isoleucyl-tRNA synthetase
MGTVMDNREPFDTVLGFATLLAEDGRPMHKSWGNAIEFNEGAEKIGVDVMRWMYARQNPSDNLLFGYGIADETRRRFHLKLWNVYNFFVTYANLDGFIPSKTPATKPKTWNVLDRWIISRLKQTVDVVNKNLEKYDAFSSSASLEEFLEDVSNWYIRRSRERVGNTSKSRKDSNEFYGNCYFVLLTLTKLLAPFTPFISDIIYRNLAKKDSVHLSTWPDFNYSVDIKLINDIKTIRDIVEKAHAERKLKQIPVRQPLNKLTIVNYQLSDQDLIGLIKDEVNVKNVEFKTGKGDVKVKLDTKITPELEEEAKTRELIRNIQAKRKEMGVDLNQKIVIKTPWLPLNNELLEKIKLITLANKLEIGEFEVNVSS